VTPAPAPERTPASTPPRPSITERFEEVDTALNELMKGKVAFNTPERMGFQESRTLVLLASPQIEAEALTQELRGRLGASDDVQVSSVAIAPVMEATLEGKPSFDVTALTPMRQPVGGESPTEWRWMVRANEEGKHALHLSMNAVIKVGGEQYPRSLKVFDRDIEVEITMVQRVNRFTSNNWQWELGTVGIPLGLWWWRRRNREKDPMAPLTGKKAGGANADV
jgi:hypothetical protein